MLAKNPADTSSVALRMIGRLDDRSIPERMAEGERAMFCSARRHAARIAERFGSPQARAKIASVLTMLLYGLPKDAPATDAGDLVRECLTAHDKALLFAHTGNPVRWEALLAALIAAAEVGIASSSGYVPNRAELAARISCALRPGACPARWGHESRAYGNASWIRDQRRVRPSLGALDFPAERPVARILKGVRESIIAELRAFQMG